MKNKPINRITLISIVAALYTVLTLAFAPISFSSFQIRLSEILMILPIYFADSIYGLTLGCLLANVIGFAMGINSIGAIDFIIGPLATLLSALLIEKFKDKRIKGLPIVSMLMPVIINMLLIGLELDIVLFDSNLKVLIPLMLQVGVGEFVSCVILGLLAIKEINRRNLIDKL